MTAKSGSGSTFAKTLKSVLKRQEEHQAELIEIVRAIAHLPRGAARSRLISRAVNELPITREQIDRATPEARATWPAETWTAEARYLKERIARLSAKGGQNGETARCRIALDEALSHAVTSPRNS